MQRGHRLPPFLETDNNNDKAHDSDSWWQRALDDWPKRNNLSKDRSRRSSRSLQNSVEWNLHYSSGWVPSATWQNLLRIENAPYVLQFIHFPARTSGGTKAESIINLAVKTLFYMLCPPKYPLVKQRQFTTRHLCQHFLYGCWTGRAIMVIHKYSPGPGLVAASAHRAGCGPV
jgi:hypothetical protein